MFIKSKTKHITEPCRQFELWLKSQKYISCEESYPVAILAASLVADFLQEEGDEDDKYRKIIEIHANAIGWISDYGTQT